MRIDLQMFQAKVIDQEWRFAWAASSRCTHFATVICLFMQETIRWSYGGKCDHNPIWLFGSDAFRLYERA